MNHGWDPEPGTNPRFTPLEVSDEEALVGFEALIRLKHSITIAPLSRFYHRAAAAENGADRNQWTNEFISAIKATVAFSFLWRGAKGGTDNIDSHYREIMRTGVEQISPLARRPNGTSGALSLANYKKALRAILKRNGPFGTKDEWIKLASKIAVYRHSSVLARFLLFCATDDAVPDETEDGLIVRGRRDRNPMLRLCQWNNDAYFTVEHIAPDSPRNGWEPSIYNDPNTVHTLGNLILLPEDVNNIIGNKSWEHKRLMYRLIAADTHEEFDNICKGLTKVGLNISKKADEVLENAEYLGICKSVSSVEDAWSIGIIEKRTRRFAELAWDRMEPWLWT